MPDPLVVDPFAGPGGWSEGLAGHGMTDVGIELDRDACATRRAAGHLTIRADMATYPPEAFRGAVGMCASPPCTDWSIAGARAGRTGSTGRLIDLVPRWVDVIRPEWFVCEQVPPCLGIWREHARWYWEQGYSVWTGILNSADFAVPQTRKRAILIASRVRKVTAPQPTHAKDPQPSMFGTLKPWVTMAAALGWGMTARPYPVIASGRTTGGPDKEKVGGSGARAALYTEQAEGRWVNTGRDWKPGGSREDAQVIDADAEPAPCLSAKSGGQWHLNPGVTDTQPNRRRYDPDAEPSPVGGGGAPPPPGGGGPPPPAANWCWERPSTTVAGDARCWPPGHKINNDDVDRLGLVEATERYGDRAGTEAIRLTVADALVLQSFRSDYPVQGSKTSQFRG